MRKHSKFFLTVVALMCFSFFHSPLKAESATYDLSKYMEWQNGGWVLYQEYDCLDLNCSPFLGEEELSGIIVNKNGDIRWHSHYNDDGLPGDWVLGDRMKYKRTSKSVNLIGIKDGGNMWDFDPVIKIPRKLKLNKPFVYNGVARYENQKFHFTLLLTIVKVNVSVNTAAGTFDDCIEVEIITSGGPEHGDVAIEIMARGVGSVKRWESTLWRESDGFEEDAFEADTEYIEAIDYGVRSPPFP